jgi:hypothetical protein
MPVCSSRARCHVYDAEKTIPGPNTPPSVAVSCAALVRRLDCASSTPANAESTRDEAKAATPVVGVMADAGA